MKKKRKGQITLKPRFYVWVTILIAVVVTSAFFFMSYPGKILAKNSESVVLAAESLQSVMADVATVGKKSVYSKADKEMAAIKERIRKGETDGLKVVFMTFDDGPSGNTNDILDILNKYHIKATFFTNGRDSEVARAAYKRIVADGHTLGNHTWSHNYGLYKTPAAFYEDVKKLDDFQKEVTGVDKTSGMFRFPGGSLNANAECIKGIVERGYNYADWNATAGDGGGEPPSTDAVVQKIMTDVRKHNVSTILCHAELRDTTRAALPKLFETLKSEGYTFLPMEADLHYPQHM